MKKSDVETTRTPNAATFQGDQYARIDLAGKLTVTNHSAKKIKLEVKRQVLGKVQSADNSGQAQMLNVFEEDKPEYPYWWSWYSWPYWWHRMNGIGEIKWNLELEPGEKRVLNYKWCYFWR